ncbi:MAG TPA: DUF885 family protein, partial [Caulobacteraceae bacterium]|nr:DUF885 family protein [Caulobacteraceae bacterium]
MTATLDRRRLLLSAAGAASLTAVSTQAFGQAPAGAPAASGEAARLNALMDRIFQTEVSLSPEFQTGLGMDTGANAANKGKLDGRTIEDQNASIARSRGYLRDMKAIDRSKLSGMDLVNYDTVLYQSETGLEGARFGYGPSGFPAPYWISQLSGAYQQIPDFLDSQHSIGTAADAEAYLSRMQAYAVALDQESEKARADAAKGVIPPDFAIDRTLTQLRAQRGAPTAQNTLVASLARRTKEKNLPGDWEARAARILEQTVNPALDRQIALVESWRPKATHDAGVWRLPDGADYYQWGVKLSTTTDMTPEDVHRMGLEQVAEISARIDEILKANGFTDGPVGKRVAAAISQPRFIYPNTEAGKAQLLADLNGQMAEVNKILPDYFGHMPKAALDIRRVPPAIEAGAPGGYYQAGTLDGSRPGAYYINLRDTAEWPKPTLPTLTWHEGSPGHHFQISLALEAQGVPMLRRIMGFGAFQEGWALYAEQLIDETGFYKDDPFGRVGYLQSLLFRAVRLVVDSGLHHKRWSREQAIRYMVDTLGDQESSVTTEVERYCVWPGQASSYKVGHAKWVEVREKAKKRLGAKFDIKGFHDAG